MKIVIAGGTGFLGHALTAEFCDRGDEVIVLSRSDKPAPNVTIVKWDGKTVGDWASALEGADAVLNVVGESVFAHWTEDKKKRIISSRVDPARALGQAITQMQNPPKVWVNASAVGYYGSIYDPATESSPPGNDFLAEVCKRWEAAQLESDTPRTKKSQTRIGFVLGNGGGAFPMLRKLTKIFLGSAQGSGKQYMAWVHVKDVAGAFRFCVEQQLEGPINVVGPQPCTNNELMAALRKKMHRPWVPNVPKFILALGSAFALPPTEVSLASQNALPERLKQLDYKFRYSTLDATLGDLLAH